MTTESTTSDEALYAILGISTDTPSAAKSIVQDPGLTGSNDRSGPLQNADVSIQDPDESRPTHSVKKKRNRGAGARLRRKTEREMQRIGCEEDSDEPVKETAHTKLTTSIDTMNEPDQVKSSPSRSNPYWMYGQGLVIPPYNPSTVKEDTEVKKEDREVEKEDLQAKKEDVEVKEEEVDVKEEEVEVKEKDFADAHPDTVVKKGEFSESATADGPDIKAPRKSYKAEDLLEQLIESIEALRPSDLSTEAMSVPPPTSHNPDTVYETPTATMSITEDEGLTTADESFATDTDTEIKPRRRFHVVQHQSPMRGSTKRRTRYQIVRHIRPDEKEPTIEVKIEEDPLPETAFQRDLQTNFSRSALLQIHELAKIDNTSGNHLPSQLRDLFPTLSDPATAITIANHLRRQFDLPILSTKTDRVALRRAVAQMRLGIYTELVSALLLPSAPEPAPDTDDEEIKEKVKKISLVPSALQYIQKHLPPHFPDDKFAIKLFLANQDPLGEIKGKVVWQDGIGTMVGGDPYGPGFRGKISSEGLVHVFVDHSNVLHGLSQRLKNNTSPALPRRHLRTLSLPILSLLLRRGRPTPHGTLHLVASSPLYQNLDPLVRLGWEVSVLKRVEIYDDEVHDSHSAKLVNKPMNNLVKVNTFHEGGSRRYKEQGVDEILHLKILQALNTKPTPAPRGSTIVLATGDAKGGQFNQDGFVGAVREAIKRGWMVELWSFSEGLSRAWKDLKKKEKWGGDFTIKLLDEWSEQLVEVGDGD